MIGNVPVTSDGMKAQHTETGNWQYELVVRFVLRPLCTVLYWVQRLHGLFVGR